jgi:hypothetical protein
VALKNDGTVVTWGNTSIGPTTVPPGLSGVTAISAGFWHTVALKSDGTVVDWGSNGRGPTAAPAGLSGVIAIAAGYGHTVALRNDGSLVVWGLDSVVQQSYVQASNLYYNKIAGTVSWDSATNSATFTPTQPLPAGATLNVAVNGVAQSQTGITISGTPSVSFTTLATDVCIAGYSPRCFDSLQGALQGALGGDTIMVRSATLTESLTHGYPTKLTVKGGYDAAYATRPGLTTVAGTLTLGGGTFVADNLVIR